MKKIKAAAFLLAVSLVVSPVCAYAGLDMDMSGTEDTDYTGDETFSGDDGSGKSKGPGENERGGTPFSEGVRDYSDVDAPVIVESVETEMEVGHDNVYHVKRKANVYFQPDVQHDVVVYIPVNKIDDSKTDAVSDIAVSAEKKGVSFETSMENGMTAVHVHEDRKDMGYMPFTLSYTYTCYGDSDETRDILMQELSGFYGYMLMSLKFTITMPDEKFTQKKIGFYDANNEQMKMASSVKGNTVTGYLDHTAEIGGVMMQLDVEDGYFGHVKESFIKSFLLFLAFAASVILTVFGFLVSIDTYIKCIKSEKIVPVRKKTPPRGLTPVDVVAAMTGGLTNRDVMLYILTLANEGYIMLYDTSYQHQKNRNPAKSYRIIKLKDYDGTDKDMERFMKLLFKRGDTVTPAELSKKIYRKINSMRIRIQDRNTKGIWETADERKRLCELAAFAIPCAVSLLLSFFNLNAGLSVKALSFIYGPLMSAGVAFLIKMVSAFIRKKDMARGGVADTMTWIYTGSALAGVLVVTGILNAAVFVKHSAVMTAAFLASMFLSYCSANMMKRTAKGTKLCAQIAGFREYLVSMESNDVKRAVLDDGQYVFKLMPYAIALEAANESYQVKMDAAYIAENPVWYKSESESDFSVAVFIPDWNAMVDAMLEKPDQQKPVTNSEN